MDRWSLEARFEDHVPGCDEEEKEDAARAALTDDRICPASASSNALHIEVMFRKPSACLTM
jgi:hypothetical protein